MSNNTLVFYANPQSRSRIVRWMLEELGIPYATEIVAYGKQMKSEPYLSINPMGKVPAIVHNDKVVTECAAICAYLADVFPAAGLAAPDDAKAAYYRWLFFAAGPLEAAITNHSLGFAVPSAKHSMVGYGSYQVTIDTLAKAVADRQYIAGESFTAADVYVGSHIGWGLQFKTIPERKVFTDYFATLSARPAYIKASQLDDELLAK